MSNLKVAVRVRPLSKREIELKSVASVAIENGVVSVTNIKVPEHHAGDSRERVRKFAFDYCYGEESSQDEIFGMIEEEISKTLSCRYNACVLAYGQSSTGKTYTMMGLQDEPGLTPRLCENIFKYFNSSGTEDEIKETHTSVSYLEIYNERVQDLLTINNGRTLRVREHPKKGPYVQGLTEHKVTTPQELISFLNTGNSNRRVAATSTNRRSSRSHSVLTISCCRDGGHTRLHLVDLAGSERASHGTAPRLKEGANINRSLVALGNVICALADQSEKQSRNSRKRFVPYRDSVLTWLLKETLGGNSKTVMIATISPSSICYSETVNTLRFGQRAKQIVNRPVVNEDAKEKLIRELRAEIQRLRELLSLQHISPAQLSPPTDSDPEMSDSPKSPEQAVEGTDEESVQSQAETDDLESSDTLCEPQVTPNKEENKSDDNKLKESISRLTKTDKLIPVIDITSTVKPKSIQLNRTFSVDFPKPVSGKLNREFGSHETLSNTSKHPLSSLFKNRRSSIRESAEIVKFVQPEENSSRSGSISESSGKSTPRKNPIQTRRVHRKSEVVAAVTQRLYSQQARKKETHKTEEKQAETSVMLPRQNLCSSARMRLQELTQRALRASKRKVHSETQTEDQTTVRVKEKSTDVQDMNIALLKVKDANISAVADTQTIGVNCLVENYHKTIKLTRSCSSQTEEPPKNQSVSFTRYLKNPPLAFHSYSQPIYTSSVNINVSHNYASQKEEISDDSLEDLTQQNVQYSTPDLISNHNSLEQNSVQNKSPKQKEEVKTANVDKSTEQFYQNEYFATDSAEYCVADRSVVPSVAEKIHDVSIPVVCASEIRTVNEFNESCVVLNETKPELVNSSQTYEPFEAKPKCFVVNPNKVQTKYASSCDYSTEDSEMDYSVSCNKKVRFCSQLKRKNMADVLQNFMDEASSLLTKLNSVTKQVERSEQIRNRRTTLVRENLDTKECYVQTYFPYHDSSSQTQGPSSLLDVSDSELLDNNWEHIVKSSCDKLEQCVKLVDHKSREEERRKMQSDFNCLHKFPQPFSSDTEWKYCPNDYSSLETTHSASDYGSLPRKDGLFRRNTYKYYSPKAYMKQLVAMRKQIVETSRNDLLEECKLPLSEH